MPINFPIFCQGVKERCKTTANTSGAHPNGDLHRQRPLKKYPPALGVRVRERAYLSAGWLHLPGDVHANKEVARTSPSPCGKKTA
jgi:hypothetical protein